MLLAQTNMHSLPGKVPETRGGGGGGGTYMQHDGPCKQGGGLAPVGVKAPASVWGGTLLDRVRLACQGALIHDASAHQQHSIAWQPAVTNPYQIACNAVAQMSKLGSPSLIFVCILWAARKLTDTAIQPCSLLHQARLKELNFSACSVAPPGAPKIISYSINNHHC